MSYWTYIDGVIDVRPMGRTPVETRYILETVLNHLPIVSGSERCMAIDIVDIGCAGSSSHDEFGQHYDRPNLKGKWQHWVDSEAEYKLIITGKLRDRYFSDTYKEFMKWLIRLAKRVWVTGVLVRITGDEIEHKWENKSVIFNYPDGLHDLLESPSWAYDVSIDEDGFPSSTNWCEYLMWDRAQAYEMPLDLFFRKYADKEVDEEYLRRFNYNEPYRRRKCEKYESRI